MQSHFSCLHMNNIKFVSAASLCYLHLSYVTVQIIYMQIYIQNIYIHLHASACLHMHVCACVSINYSYTTTTRIHLISC